MKTTYRKKTLVAMGAALLAVASVCPVRADYQSTLLSYGPIGFWRFDQTNTSSSPPLNVLTNASALGSIGNGYCVDDPVKGVTGIIGNCVNFVNPNVSSDVGYVGNKIDVPWNAALNPNPPFSVEFWANPAALSYDGTGFCPLSNFDPNFGGGGSRAGWLFYLNDTGTWQFRLGNRAGYAGIVTASGGTASPGTWQHIVATWDGTTANLYANGALVASTPVAFANWVNNPQNFIRFGATPLTGDNAEANYISALSDNGNRGYDGLLEEVAIYTNVLSATTVNAHYRAASTNNAGYDAQILTAKPVGYWPMHDAAFTDSSPPYPVVVNSGSIGMAANATNFPGSLVNQPGPGYAGFGTNNKAIFFDGDNGYCQISDTPQLHWATNDGVTINYITLAAWINPTEENFFRNIISHGWNVYEGDYAETFLRISPGVGSAFVGDGNYYEIGASDGVNFYDSVLVPIPQGDIGNWVFIAGTFDGANWNLYRNGQLEGTIPANSGSSGGWDFDDGANNDTGAYDVTNYWTIGSRGTDPFFVGQEMSFGGSIDAPAIFNTALTAGQVMDLYNAAEVPPVITQAPQNPGTVFTGSSVPFSVWADGNATLTYLWYTNGVSTGDTATNYTLTGVIPGTYTVSVVVSNPYGTNTPSVTFNVVNAPPTITSQPAPQERYVGDSFTLSVGVTGTTPLTYYWKLGNAVVQSGLSSNYTAVASLANGGTYTVVISNVTGINATSAPVVVTVKSVPAGYAGVIVGDAPMSFWRLDETSGNEAFDVISGNNGTYFNATLGVPGYSSVDPDDLAASFNGPNSYVGNISGTAINFPGHTNFTLEAWVNAPAGQSDQATIIAKGIGNNGTTETEQFSVDVFGGNYRFFDATRGSAAVNEVDASEGPNGTWQHVVAVYDDMNTLGGGSNMYIYVNGVLEGTHATYASGLQDTTSPMSIGSKRTGNDPTYDGTFDGSIDEVAVYSYALSSVQVSNHYAAAYGSTLAPVISLQPVSVTNYVGLPITLSVSAYGSVPLSYQWLSNNVAVSGANSPDYTSTNAPGLYSVTITNLVGHTNSITVQIVVLNPPTNPPVIPGLVMHLPFDGNLNDVTGRGNNGVGVHVYQPAAIDTNNSYASNTTFAVTNFVNPDPSNPLFYYPVDGVVGSALHYSTYALELAAANTSIGTNDYFVTLGVRPNLQFGSNDFTVSLWIRLPLGYGIGPVSGGGGDLPFFTDTVGSEGNPGYVFAPAYGFGTASPNPTPAPANYGGWATTIYNSAAAGIRLYGDEGSINDGNWHSLVYVVNHPVDHVITYLDGIPAHYILDAGTTLDAAGDIDTSNPATIGQDPTGQYGELGSADIDDLGVWKRALTPLEAASIYIAGISNALSFTAPGTMTIYPTNGHQLAISWPSGTLQSAPNVTGVYTNIPGAVSPYVFAPSGTSRFFRVLQ